MFKKNSALLLVLFSLVFIFNVGAARAQESETAAASSLTGIALPAGAQRLLPESVPASITEGFDKVMPKDGSIERGELETLVWMGDDYKQANAPAMISRLTGALKIAGRRYSVESEENGVTVFSALKEGAKRRVVLGYYGATKEALVLAWTELLPAAQNNAQNDTPVVEDKPVRNTSSGSGGSVLGSWYDGYSSILVGYTPTYGPKSFTPGRSNYFKYTFHQDGTFDFTGLMQFNEYGCTTAYFQDKRGRYTINGSRITLTKNFWRQHNSCAPSSNKEINHNLDPETYTYAVRRNKYSKEEVCLSSGDNTPCYERTQE